MNNKELCLFDTRAINIQIFWSYSIFSAQFVSVNGIRENLEKHLLLQLSNEPSIIYVRQSVSLRRLRDIRFSEVHVVLDLKININCLKQIGWGKRNSFQSRIFKNKQLSRQRTAVCIHLAQARMQIVHLVRSLRFTTFI